MDAEFKAQFQKLQAAGVACDEKHAKAEHAVYEVLANAYIFYQQHRHKPSYFTDMYDAEQIPWRNMENRVNFRPFIRVLFRLDLKNPTAADKERQRLTPGSQLNRVENYSIVMDMFDEAWTSRPDDFNRRPLAQLLGLIHQRSIQSLVRERRELNAQVKGKNKPEDEAEIEQTRKVLAENAMSELKRRATPLATVKMSKNTVLDVNSDGMTACICRYDAATNSYEVIAAADDQSAMHAIAARGSMKLDNVGSRALRTIAEVVATQSFPSKHIPSGRRDKLSGALRAWYNEVYLEKSNLAKPKTVTKRDDDGTDKKVKQNIIVTRKLVLRGKQSILLSAQRTTASVVTILIPNQPINPSATDDVSMRGSNLRMVEEWIENGTIAARVSEPRDKLGKPKQDTKSKYALKVRNIHSSAQEKYLHFEDIYRAAVSKHTFGQVDLNLAKFKSTWSFNVKRDWLMTLQRDCLDQWFEHAASNKKLKRAENSLLSIAVSKQQFTVGYEIDEHGKNPSTTIPLTHAAKLASTQTFMAFAKDLAPVLNNMTALSLVGDIKFSGDASIMLVEFSTELGSYTIAVPTLEKQGNKYVRSEKYFVAFGKRS
jgi:hypothetical protein